MSEITPEVIRDLGRRVRNCLPKPRMSRFGDDGHDALTQLLQALRAEREKRERLQGLLRRIERAWNPCGGESDRPFDDFNYNGDLFDALESVEEVIRQVREREQ